MKLFEEFLSSDRAAPAIREALEAADEGSARYIAVLHWLGYVDPVEYFAKIRGMIDRGALQLGDINTYALNSLSLEQVDELVGLVEGSGVSDMDAWLDTLQARKGRLARP